MSEYKLVPVEPDEKMRTAAIREQGYIIRASLPLQGDSPATDVYKAMVKAAPDQYPDILLVPRAEYEADMKELAEWRALVNNPALLHTNLLRGFPAPLSAEQLMHLIGDQNPVLEALKRDAERYRWLREHSRDPDEERPYCVMQVYTPFQEQHLVFDERLDNAIDAAIASAIDQGKGKL
jgi:hypothetical protein